MKNRLSRMLALFTCMVMAILALCAVAASGEENIAGFLGKPFPDFTATDTEGNTFTLSEALKDHEAVLISSSATELMRDLTDRIGGTRKGGLSRE